jgi:hypothetical protein
MINVMNKKCDHDLCFKSPSYNYINEKKPKYCVDHKLENMVDVVNKNCIFQSCSNRAIYNMPDEKPLYCAAHKTENMIDLINKRCAHLGCTKYPTFNYIGQIKRKYCLEHKKENMVNVMNNKCCHPSCFTQAIYNFSDQKKALYCVDHKTDDMIDIRHNICTHVDCKTRANFIVIGEKKPLFCSKHKLPDMIDITVKRCLFKGCIARPSCNYIGEKKPLYCDDHKLDNMVDVRKKILTCIHKECKSIPLFNFKDKKAIYCDKHKKENMINIQIKLKCCECDNLPILSLDNKYYCGDHYPNKNLIDETKKMCSIHDLANTTYICDECKTASNHPKEYKVVYYVKNNINKKCITDSNLPVSECSKRRPDIYYECDKHIVIIEVDEHQHRNYHEECECKRINEIVSSIGGKSVIFIRYNPDKIMNKKKEIEISNKDRLDKLIEVIKKELNTKYKKITVKLIQLFYNDNNKIYEFYKEENITNKVMI